MSAKLDLLKRKETKKKKRPKLPSIHREEFKGVSRSVEVRGGEF